MNQWQRLSKAEGRLRLHLETAHGVSEKYAPTDAARAARHALDHEGPAFQHDEADHYLYIDEEDAREFTSPTSYT